MGLGVNMARSLPRAGVRFGFRWISDTRVQIPRVRWVRGGAGFDKAAAMSGDVIRSYRDLRVWQRGMALAVECYRLAARFPRHETYGLASQARRAETSLATNIAEGHARPTKAYRNHVSVALGSQAELETLLELAVGLGYVTEAETAPIRAELEQIGRMLHRLADSLDRKILEDRAEPRW